MDKYAVNLAWSDEDEGYIATIPEFQNLSAFGATPEEALKEVRVALQGFIEVAQNEGVKLPDPQTLSDYSGQIRIRMPVNLHMRLATQAAHNRVSLNTYMVTLLAMNFSMDAILHKQKETIHAVISSLTRIQPESDSRWAAKAIDDIAYNYKKNDTTVKYGEV